MKGQSRAVRKGAPTVMTTAVPEAESERRLRPVIDALYANKHKQASKLVQQALQKRPLWPAARALRACVLLQTNRLPDAIHQVEEIRRDIELGRVPVDEDAAKKLHMFYHEIRQERLSGVVYEQAWRADMSQIHLAEVAFAMYIRGGAFDDARQIAKKLASISHSLAQKHMLWVAASIWLAQVVATRESRAARSPDYPIMLKLSSAMVSKAIAASPAPPAPETVRFAVRIFKEASEFDKARQLLANPRVVMNRVEVLHLCAELDFEQSRDPAVYRTLLMQTAPNDWAYWVHYFECVESSDTWQTDVEELVHQVIAMGAVSSKEPLRGPYLARLELMYRSENWERLAEEIVAYFNMFGAKQVCARDLRPYFVMLQAQEPLFEAAMEQVVAIGAERGFHFHLNACWLQLWCDTLSEPVESLVNRYFELLADALETTDRQPGDDYLLLAAHTILPIPDSAEKDRYEDPSGVMQCVLLLEYGLTRSPFNLDFKLLLIRLYESVGGMERVCELWESLDIKHVQISTLTHLVLKPLIETGHHDALRSLLDAVDTLWNECDREIPDCISRAFHSGSINAAVEFVLFRQRIQSSAILAEAMVAEAQLSLLLSGGEHIKTALNCLTKQARFSPSDLLSSRRMVNNDDESCLQFWNVDEYDANCRLESAREDLLERGMECSPARFATIRATAAAMVRILSMTVRNTTVGDEVEEREQGEHIDMEGIEGIVPHDVELRVRISNNLQDMHGLLSRWASPSAAAASNGHSSNGAADKESVQATGTNGEEVAKIGVGLAGDILKLVEDVHVVVDQDGGSGHGHTKLPRHLRQCCKIASDTLLLTAVGVASFGPLVARVQKKMKRLSSRVEAGEADMQSEFRHVKRALGVYREAVLECCSTLEKWVTTFADERDQWIVGNSGKAASKLVVKLLPTTVRPIRLVDGVAVEGNAHGVCEFWNAILEGVYSSQTVTCSSLLHILTATANRLAPVDLGS